MLRSTAAGAHDASGEATTSVRGAARRRAPVRAALALALAFVAVDGWGAGVAPPVACAGAPDVRADATAWDDASIRASRRETLADASPLPPAAPRVLAAVPDDASIVVVADAGPPAARRIAARPGLLPALAPSPDGLRAYWATCDGWIGIVDLVDPSRGVEVRAALRVAGLAVSGDGRHVAVASLEPPALLLFDADLAAMRRLPARDAAERRSSPVTSVADATSRRAFVASLPAIGELWEISYDPAAQDIPTGLVHDFRLREGAFVRGFLNPRRSPLDEPPDRVRVDPRSSEVAVATAGGAAVGIVQLDVRRRIATLRTDAEALPDRAAAWRDGARRVLAVPLRGGGLVPVDLGTMKAAAAVATPGEVAAVVSRAGAPRAWLRFADGAPGRDALRPLDPATLEPGPPWRPRPERAVVGAAFGHDGRRLYVATGGPDARLDAFDAGSLQPAWSVPLPGEASVDVAPAAAEPRPR